MKYFLGIDTGTTSISLAAVNEADGLITSRTVNHASFIAGNFPNSRIQDPEKISRLVLDALENITAELGQPQAIGFTGQMHGILYVDAAGNSISPLYTWQDGSGNDCVKILQAHGVNVASGYGLATHYFLQRAGKIPEGAKKITTISDYIAMKICGKNQPVISPDMAASWGGFDIVKKTFHFEKLHSIGVDTSYFPTITRGYEIIGETLKGVPVLCSMGDNQASFMGAVNDENNSVLLNVGTGSQISIATKNYYDTDGSIEIRPYGEKYILAGSSLCGGRAYAMLEKFYREISGQEYYSIMERQAEEFINSHSINDAWEVSTTFMGTRTDPAKRGSITGISEGNFCAGAFTAGVIRGILAELYAYYDAMKNLTGCNASVLVGSGNGLRKNNLMQKMAGEIFKMPLLIPSSTEEAATGAALCVMKKI